MMKSFRSALPSILFIALLFSGLSCGKGGGNTPAPNPCSGITVVVSATTSNPGSPGATNGSITATATGGSGFTFSLNGGPFQASGSFTGLGAGSYTISAKNSNGCTGSANFTLTAPNPCAGVTITVSGTPTNPTAPGTNNGSIAATASGGAGPYTYSRDGVNFQATGTFSNLGEGSYTITAKDANGCTGSVNFNLTAPNPCAGVTITVGGTFTNPTAPGATNGSISATASGGTGPYTFNINGGAFQSGGSFGNLAAGSYTVSAKDANGCTGSGNFTLTAPNPCAGVTITVSTSVVGNTPCSTSPTGSISATASGGTGPYTYSINGGAFQASGNFTGLNTGSYTITAKDNNGCTGSASANVSNRPQGPLFTAVKLLLQNNCNSCHNNTVQNGGMNWEVDCNIVNFKTRIQDRAVNGNPSPMPPSGLLPVSERQKITDWINAGGRYTD